MRVRCLLLSFLAGLSPRVLAQPDISVADVTRKVLASANSYAKGIACETAEATAKDVGALVPVGPSTEQDQEGVGTFAVIWRGDIGCQGGSSTVTDNIAIVSRGAYGSFVVDAGQSSPQVSFDTSVSTVDRLVRATGDTLVLDGRKVCDGSTSLIGCEIRVRITMRQDKDGSWKAISQRDLKAR